MTDIVQEVETAAANLWGKFVAWVKGDVIPTLQADEKALLALLQPLFGAAEAEVLQDLTVFVRGVLTQAQSGQDLATLEAAVMNGLQTVGGELLATAKGLGSNVLQALIGLILAQLSKAA